MGKGQGQATRKLQRDGKVPESKIDSNPNCLAVKLNKILLSAWPQQNPCIVYKKLMRCYNQTESLLYSKYIFSVITMYTIDFGNFNMRTHAKGITNRASSHPHEPWLIKATSTPQERLFSTERYGPHRSLFPL